MPTKWLPPIRLGDNLISLFASNAEDLNSHRSCLDSFGSDPSPVRPTPVNVYVAYFAMTFCFVTGCVVTPNRPFEACYQATCRNVPCCERAAFCGLPARFGPFGPPWLQVNSTIGGYLGQELYFRISKTNILNIITSLRLNEQRIFRL